MNRGYWARCDQRGSWMVKRLFYRHCLKIRSDSSSQLYLPRRESGAHSFPAFCTLSIPSSGPGDRDASPSHETMMLVLHLDQDTMMLLLFIAKPRTWSSITPLFKSRFSFWEVALFQTFLDPGPNQSKIQHTHNVESINLVQGTQFREKCIYIKVMHDHECMYTVLQGQIYHAQWRKPSNANRDASLDGILHFACFKFELVWIGEVGWLVY